MASLKKNRKSYGLVNLCKTSQLQHCERKAHIFFKQEHFPLPLWTAKETNDQIKPSGKAGQAIHFHYAAVISINMVTIAD